MKLHNRDILMIEIDDEPVEYCSIDSCMWNTFKIFKNKVIKEIFNKMIADYDKIFRLDIKKNKVKINIDWYSNNFNDDLWEYDFDKIKHTIANSFITCGIISRKDKLFNNNYLDIINISKVPYSNYDIDIKNDKFLIKIIFEL